MAEKLITAFQEKKEHKKTITISPGFQTDKNNLMEISYNIKQS